MDVFVPEERRGNRRSRSARRKSRFGFLIGCSSLIFGVFLSIIAYAFFFKHGSVQKIKENIPRQSVADSFSALEVACEEDFCVTKQCINIASRIISYMDKSVNPCEDFYEYACGNYRMHKYARYGETTYDVFNEAFDNIVIQVKRLFDDPKDVVRSGSFVKAHMLYESCMNTTGRDEGSQIHLRQFLSKVGLDWPMLENADDVNNVLETSSWLHVVTEMEKYGFHMLFEPKIKTENGEVVVEVDCNMPMLPTDIYLDQSSDTSNIQLRFYQNVILLIFDLYGLRRREGRKVFEGIVNLETEIAHAVNVPVNGEGYPLSEEHMMQLKDLWANVLGTAPSDIQIKPLCKGNLESIMSILNRASKRTLMNYIGWLAISHLLQFLGRRHKSLYNHYVNRLVDGQIVAPGAWRECSELLSKEMGLVTAKALKEKGYFNIGQRHEVLKRFQDMKQAFAYLLYTIPWMDNQTAAAFIDKLSKMTLNFGVHDVFYTEVQYEIDNMFNDLHFNPSESFLKNLMLLKKFKVSRYYSNLLSDSRREGNMRHVKHSLDYSPLGTSAHYIYEENKLEMDYGFLVTPLLYYDASMPRYLEYGQDIVLAREISRAFDTTGIAYDGNGNKIGMDALPPLVHQKFFAFVTCLSHQLSVNPIPENMHEINDAIADLGSFYLTFAGLLNHLLSSNVNDTDLLPGVHLEKQQIYLVQATQLFCEALDKPFSNLEIRVPKEKKPRVNIAVANMVGIAKHFGCSRGSALDPIRKCNLLI